MMQAPRTVEQKPESKRAPKLGRNYWRLWWANAVSSTGDGAFVAALPLLAVTITRDPRLVSVVTAAMYLPWMVLSLPAGALVDRYDRATLMWRAQAVQAAVVAVVTVLVIAREANIAVLGVAGLLLGSAEVIFSNAAQSVLPDLVPPELLPKANGSQQISLTVGESFLGPPAGSLLFAAAAALPFGLDAVSFAGSAALLARLPKGQRAKDAARPGIKAQIAEGLRWLVRHRLLRVVAVLLGVYNFANQMGQAILVLLATETLHVSVRGYGLLLAASAAGSVVGGLVNPVLTRRLGMLASLIIGGAVNAAVFVGIGLAPDPAVAAVLLAGQGFAVAMWNVVTVSLRQQIVPSALLGRVNSVYRMLGWGLMPVGALAGGFVAHAEGLRAPYIIAGALCGLALLVSIPFLLAAARIPRLPAPTLPPARLRLEDDIRAAAALAGSAGGLRGGGPPGVLGRRCGHGQGAIHRPVRAPHREPARAGESAAGAGLGGPPAWSAGRGCRLLVRHRRGGHRPGGRRHRPLAGVPGPRPGDRRLFRRPERPGQRRRRGGADRTDHLRVEHPGAAPDRALHRALERGLGQDGRAGRVRARGSAPKPSSDRWPPPGHAPVHRDPG